MREATISLLLERARRALAPEFEVEGELGAGGMGVVFAARDRRLDRRVAIKVLRPEAATAVAAERFLREARLQARLHHPNVVTVHRAGEADGLPYFAMELVEGETLAARLARGTLPGHEVRALATDVLAALTAAHRQGIVHRDVKPSNIFLVDGRALLADFGIARGETSGDDALTQPGLAPGTPGYMAPEQLAGSRATMATDVYAAGLVLFEAVTGRPWPLAANPAAADWSGVPPEFVPGLRRALAPTPEERWPSAESMARALQHVPAARGTRAAAATVLLALLAGGAYWAAQDRGRALSDFGGALPASGEGRRLLREAEGHYRQARWREADSTYRLALNADATCLICAFRLNDVSNWLQQPRDVVHLALLADHAEAFPLQYRRLLEADQVDHPARLDRLREVTDRWPDFALGWYMYGEDLYNRGSLFGRERDGAIAALRRAVTLDSSFAPPWFDLALAQIAEGDSAGAAEAVSFLAGLQPTGDLAQAQRVVAYVAFGFRFDGTGMARYHRLTGEDRRLAGMPHAAAGPRVMSGLNVPWGAVELGREYEGARAGLEGRAFRKSGLIAQVFGHAALGQRQEMHGAAARLVRDVSTPVTRSLAPRLEAALLLWEDDLDPGEAVRAAGALEPFLRPGVQADVQDGAAWMLALLAYRAGNNAMAARHADRMNNEDGAGPRSVLLRSWGLAARGHVAQAIDDTEALASSLRVFDEEPDPFLRAAVRLSRALWLEQVGSPWAARDEYRWHQHFHMASYPKDDPTAAEVDWALSTLASWRKARLLDGREEGPELCAAYRTVAERWSLGERPYRDRAGVARVRLRALGCQEDR